jgi:GntP family gluconate:H+ symporter
MDPTTGTILILLIGVAVVIGGILALRLPAFLALILAALIVAGLTPTASLERFALEQAALDVSSTSPDGIWIATGNTKPVLDQPVAARDNGVRVGDGYVLFRFDPAARRYGKVADLRVAELKPNKTGESELALLVPEGGIAIDDYRKGDLVLQPLAVRAARKETQTTIGERIAKGFGDTCTSIAILIALAGIVGKCLLESGAADKIVRTMIRWFGESGAPLAFMLSGFLLGIPVFFDTVFFLMIPLGKAMRLRVGKNYLQYVLTIICGATMTHSLVPPTPGPLFAANELGVGLAKMIGGGCVVAMAAALAGYLFAAYVNRRDELPLRESEGFSLAEVEQAMQVEESALPPFWLSVLPVLLPVVLIAGLAFLDGTATWKALSPGTKAVLKTLGDKNIAMAIAAALGIVTVIRQKGAHLKELARSLETELSSAGMIILITAAGGAFGLALRQTGVSSLFGDLSLMSPAALCTMAFLITCAVRTAQGSATVAMITASGFFSDLARNPELGFDPVYLALAIGCGSKPIAWMNDSGFWVMTRMSGMTEKEGLRYITPMTALMAVAGLATVLLGVTVLPNW